MDLTHRSVQPEVGEVAGLAQSRVDRSLGARSLWDMFTFNAPVFCDFVRELSGMQLHIRGIVAESGDKPLSADDVAVLSPLLGLCAQVSEFFEATGTGDRLVRLAARLQTGCALTEVQAHLQVVEEVFQDELNRRVVLFMPASRAPYFSGDNLFGAKVAFAFPHMADDIDEAGKCFATGRYTASVYHLMRVMEAGVKAFGARLGIAGTDTRNWDPIVKDINKAIEEMPRSDAKTRLAEASSHLSVVRIAWRNPTMHPQATYTEDRAKEIFDATRTFTQTLADTIGILDGTDESPTPLLSSGG